MLFLYLIVLSVFSSVFMTAGVVASTLNVAISGSPTSRDPRNITESVSVSILMDNVYEALVSSGRGNHLTLEPALATDWQVNNGGKEWEFTLRKGVKFHDGSLMDAEDVVASFREVPQFKGVIEKTGPYKVRIIFTEKRAGFLKTIAQITYTITKRQENGILLGTGPFRIESWDPESMIRLKKFDQYWGSVPDLEEVVYHCSTPAWKALDMMAEDEIDVIDIIPPSLADSLRGVDDIELSVLEGVNISFVHMNLNNPPLDNVEFRRALNMLIHTDKIIRDVHFNEASACRGVLPPVIGGKSEGPPRIAYDSRIAKEIIEKFLDDDSRTFKMVGLPFARPYCPTPSAQARLIAGYLKGAGLKISYVPTSSMEEYQRYMGSEDYDFIISGWNIDTRNPDDFYSMLFGLGDTRSPFHVHWVDEEFESNILQARTTISLKKQWEFYNAADDLFFTNYPWIMIAHTNQLGAFRKEIKGLTFSATGELHLNNVSKTE